MNHQRSESIPRIEKHEDGKRMSVLHEGAFIVTICMAQILALSGLGQGLGKSFSTSLRFNQQVLPTKQDPAPLHIVGDSFGDTNEGQLSWYLAAFSLTFGTFILPPGTFKSFHARSNSDT